MSKETCDPGKSPLVASGSCFEALESRTFLSGNVESPISSETAAPRQSVVAFAKVPSPASFVYFHSHPHSQLDLRGQYSTMGVKWTEPAAAGMNFVALQALPIISVVWRISAPPAMPVDTGRLAPPSGPPNTPPTPEVVADPAQPGVVAPVASTSAVSQTVDGAATGGRNAAREASAIGGVRASLAADLLDASSHSAFSAPTTVMQTLAGAGVSATPQGVSGHGHGEYFSTVQIIDSALGAVAEASVPPLLQATQAAAAAAEVPVVLAEAAATAIAPARDFFIPRLGSPYMLLHDSLGAITEEFAGIPLATSLEGAAAGGRAWWITTAVVAADVLLLWALYQKRVPRKRAVLARR